MAIFLCPVCPKSFNRKEHQQRHTLTHTSTRPYSCPLCAVCFSRKDALLRHVRLHADMQASTSGAATHLRRTALACQNCVVLKARCSDQKPCETCRELGINCTMQSPKRH